MEASARKEPERLNDSYALEPEGRACCQQQQSFGNLYTVRLYARLQEVAVQIKVCLITVQQFFF